MSDRARSLVCCVILIAAVLAVFWPVLGHQFTTWDDYLVLVENPKLNPPSWANMLWFWREPYIDFYVPMTYVVWSGLAWVGQIDPAHARDGVRLDPFIFHTANLILHVACVLAAYALLRRLGAGAWAACAGAMVFALHPVQVEPVAWTAGLKDLLCGLLSLLALYLFVVCVKPRPVVAALGSGDEEKAKIATDGRGFTRGKYLAAIAVFVLAMFAKPSAVVLPAIAWVLAVVVMRRPWRATTLALLPWVVLAIPIVLWTRSVQPAHIVGSAAYFWQRPLIAGDALAFYLYKLVWPARLAIDYGRTPTRVMESSFAYVMWLIPAGVAVVLWLLRRKLPREVLAGAMIFLLGVAPVLGLIPFDFQFYSTVGDHYLYVSMFGVALAIAGVLERARSRIVQSVVVLLLIAMGIRSHMQTWTWRDSRALFTHALAVNPQSFAAFNSLAALEVRAGNYHEAQRLALQAVNLRPDSAEALTTLGSALANLQKIPDATTFYRQALKLRPDDARILSNLSGILAAQQQFDEAIRLASAAVKNDPEYAPARLNLGTLLAQFGRDHEAITELRIATRLDPTSVQAHTNLAMLLAAAGQVGEARRHFETALRIDPTFEPARQGLDSLRQGTR